MKQSTVYWLLAVAALSACGRNPAPPYVSSVPVAPPAPGATTQTAPAAAAAQFKAVAGLQDIMAYEVDPSADALWAAVSIVTDKHGVKDHHPTTDRQWDALRGRAVVLIEAANLLIMDGRRVAREGLNKLDDQGTPGNYSADQAQQAIDADRGTYVSYARGLGVVGEQMLKAIDAKNPHDLMDAGGALDAVCEGCHLKFWYPGQRIPAFPGT